MPRRFLRLLVPVTAVACAPFTLGLAADDDPARLAREVLPILSDACFACHGPDERARKGGLRLDTPEGQRSAGRSGRPAVVPGDPDASELYRRLTTTDPDDKMPPPDSHRTVAQGQIGRIRDWITSGARWGRHWAYEPPVRPRIPRPDGAPVANPVDAFVRARLEQEGLAPSHEAPAATLIRRVTLDLTGLPPTPDEVTAFVSDPGHDAYPRLVDRLLASPRFGERFAWDWMEAARYADSNGYQGDGERTMWPWRDWVVDAFNRNLPFDQFTLWQVAGDRLPAPSHEQRLATGFLRNHMINGEGGRIPEENRIDYLFDQAETVATVWLGSTFNCTRCHDHKYDPFTQRDYYALMAFFNRTRVDGSGGNPQTPPVLEVPTAAQAERLAETGLRLDAAIRATEAFESVRFAATNTPPSTPAVPKDPPGGRDAGRLEALAREWEPVDPVYPQVLRAQASARKDRDAAARAVPRVMVMEDLPEPRPTFILERGDYLRPGARVEAALPASLAGGTSPVPADRLGLARWLVDPGNPLTARVTVNRIWQSLFGTGLVRTPEDFGLQGERPSHPELLDWLAIRFIESGWDLKALVRLLVTSATYRQTSAAPPDAWERDPENRLLARGPRFRMPSWMIRDAALAASGLLVGELGGAPVKPYQPPGVWEETTFGNKRYVQDHGAALYRRSLQVFWRRIVGPTMFFDVANRQTCTVRTPRTNVPLHALLTLNDTAHVEAARHLAHRILMAGGTSDADRLAAAFLRVLARPPRPDESRVLLAGLERHRRTFSGQTTDAGRLLEVGESRCSPPLDPTEHAAWTLVCATLLNLDEALTKE